MNDPIKIKELFENIVRIDEQLKMDVGANKKSVIYFTRWVILITILEIVNIFVHTFL